MDEKSVIGVAVGYVAVSAIAGMYYLGQADTNDSGTVTKAEFDAAIEAANPLVGTLFGPGIAVAEELFAVAGMIEEAEPAA